MSVSVVYNARLERDLLLLPFEMCPLCVLTSACGEGNAHNEWFEALPPHLRRVRLAVWRMGCCTVVLWCLKAAAIRASNPRLRVC